MLNQPKLNKLTNYIYIYIVIKNNEDINSEKTNKVHFRNFKEQFRQKFAI